MASLSTSQSYDRLDDGGEFSGPIDEIVATSRPFRGDSGTVFIGLIGGYNQFGIFDSSGGAGVFATRLGYSQSENAFLVTVAGVAAAAVPSAYRTIAAAHPAVRRIALGTGASYFAVFQDLGFVELPGVNADPTARKLLGGFEVASGLGTLGILGSASTASPGAVIFVSFGAGYSIGRGLVGLTGDFLTAPVTSLFCALDSRCL